MSNLDPDVHDEFENMITVQLARKAAEIAHLEAELKRVSAELEQQKRQPEVRSSAPTLILPPSVLRRQAVSTAQADVVSPPAYPAQEAPAQQGRETIPASAGESEELWGESNRPWRWQISDPAGETKPAAADVVVASNPLQFSAPPEELRDSTTLPSEVETARQMTLPPASPSGWGDPMLREHFGMRPLHKIALMSAAAALSLLVVGTMVRGMLDSGLSTGVRHASAASVNAPPAVSSAAPPEEAGTTTASAAGAPAQENAARSATASLENPDTAKPLDFKALAAQRKKRIYRAPSISNASRRVVAVPVIEHQSASVRQASTSMQNRMHNDHNSALRAHRRRRTIREADPSEEADSSLPQGYPPPGRDEKADAWIDHLPVK